MNAMDALDRRIVNALQGGFPVTERPFTEVAQRLGTDEDTLIARLQAMLDSGLLSRFGPLYHAERMGGALTLAAMRVPEARFEEVAAQVSAFPEVAHNYRREHAFNMWFVLATERPERIDDVLDAIRERTGLPVYNMPKLEEFYVGLHFQV